MLIKTFKARFYDGVSNQGKTVDITDLELEYRIDYFENGNQITLIWPKVQTLIIQNSNAIISMQFTFNGTIQQLDITDRGFIENLRSNGKGKKKSMSLISRLLLILFAFLVVCISFYFWTLPWIADRVAMQFPKEYEISLGEQIANAQLQGQAIDVKKSKALQYFFNLLKVPDDYPIHIRVVNDEIPNAYALPGGNIVVYSKMLKLVKNESQLAALLLHEFSHVQLKHSTRGIFRNMAGTLFLSILFSDAGGITGVLVNNGNELRNLSYTRELESEADDNALKLLDENRINKIGMAQLFEILKKQSHGMETNEILSTHPDLENRIEKVNTYKNAQTPVINDSFRWAFEKVVSK